MKKEFCALVILCFIISLTACNKTPLPQETTIPPASDLQETVLPVISEHPPMSAVFLPTLVSEERAEDGALIFTHSTQNMLLTNQDAGVSQKITDDFLSRMTVSNQVSQEILESAKQNYDSEHWTPYLCHLLYNPTRIDQHVLSLFRDYVEYNGTMHANKTNLSVNYDLTTGDVLTLAGILKAEADPTVFPDLLITQLSSRKQELSLYTGYEEFVRQRFAVDASKDEDFYFSPTGLCFYFEPYEIAPYSSGTVIAEIPYSELKDLVDENYFPISRQKTSSILEIIPFDPSESSGELTMVETILDPDGMMLKAFSNDSVYNIKLIMEGPQDQKQDKVLFMAEALMPGESLLIQANEEQLASLILTYENSAGVQELHL